MVKRYLRSILSSIKNPVWQSWGAVFLTLLVLLSTYFFYLQPSIQQSSISAANFQIGVAQHIQDLLTLDLTSTFSQLNQFSENVLDSHNPQNMSVESANFLQNSGFTSFLILNLEGKPVLANAATTSGTTYNNYAQSLFFKQALSGDEYISPVYVSPSGPMLRIAEPIRKNGTIVGIGSGEINASLLWSTVQSANVPDGKVYVVDSMGTIIADQSTSLARSGASLYYRDIVKKLLSGDSTVELSAYLNSQNSPVIASGIQMQNTGWAIVVEQSRTQTFSARNATIEIAYGFGLASLALIIMLLIATLRLTRSNSLLVHDREIIKNERNVSQQVIAGVTDAIIAVDIRHHILTFNPAAEDLSGVKEQAVLNTSLRHIFNFFDKEGQLVPIEEICPTDGKTQFRRNDMRLITQKGESYVDVVASSFSSSVTTTVSCILTIRDITKNRRLEKLKTDFVAVAAHQMRTPLTGIKWALNLCLDGSLGSLGEEYSQYLKRALETTNKLIEILNNMLDVDKVESDTIKLRKQPVDMTAIVHTVVSEVELDSNMKKIKIVFDASPDEIIVDVDVEQTKIAFRNLLDNAIKYTASEGTIHVDIKKNGLLVTVSIADSGIGIPEEEKKEIFQRFYRASNATQQETTGSGLGLYLVKTIIDREGGTIRFESTQNVGTTFYVSFPITSKIS